MSELRVVQPNTPRIKVVSSTGGEVRVVDKSVPRVKILFKGAPGRDGTSGLTTGEVIASGATDGQVPVFNEVSGQYEPTDFSGGGTDTATVGAIAAGSTLGLQQRLLANAGQPGLSILAVGYTNTGKVQGVSLGDGNVVSVYRNGVDFVADVPIWETTAGQAAGYIGPEFMSLGEAICFTGLETGAIVTSTTGFHGASELVEGFNRSSMPLLSYGLSFKKTLFFAHRNSNFYNPGGAGGDQGWVHLLNGPLRSTVKFTDGFGVTVNGQENVELNPWDYHRFYTDGNKEYGIDSTNDVFACFSGNMDLDPNARFYDCRPIMPLSNDLIGWSRLGFISAPVNNTQVEWFTQDGDRGFLNSGQTPGGVSPGSPISADAPPPVGTGADDSGYSPSGATRYLFTGEGSGFSGADGAGLEATCLFPSNALSQIVPQYLFIQDAGGASGSSVTIVSSHVGTARIYEHNTATNQLDLAYTVPLTRKGVTISSKEDQKHPAAGQVSNDAGNVPLVGRLGPGVIIADVPIGVIIQNQAAGLSLPIRSQGGSTTNSIINGSDESISLGVTPSSLKAQIREGDDGILYRSSITSGVETWVVA